MAERSDRPPSKLPDFAGFPGATRRIRTDDLLITNSRKANRQTQENQKLPMNSRLSRISFCGPLGTGYADILRTIFGANRLSVCRSPRSVAMAANPYVEAHREWDERTPISFSAN